MDGLTIVTLTLEQAEALYDTRMKRDFPPDELKPFSMIRDAVGRDEYVCYGAMNEGEIVAYAFFARYVINGRALGLLDYFAVVERLRDQGIGGAFLNRLAAHMRDMDAVIIEVEEPSLARDPEERNTRQRRLDFYLRCGMREGGVQATLYGVDYRLLTMPVGRSLDPDDVRWAYDAIYRAMLPETLYKTIVDIH